MGNDDRGRLVTAAGAETTVVAGGLRLTLPGRPPLTNAERSGHWRAHREATRAWRETAGWAAKAGRCSAIVGPVTVTSWPTYRTGRSWPDVGAWAPALKAVVDGLVDAGILPADTADIVRYVHYHPPLRGDRDALVVEVVPITEEAP